MFRIGLTGGIGSGKSTVASEFRKLNVAVIDLDQVSRDAVKAGEPGLETLIEYFGTSILNREQALDRAVLREKVFNSAKDRDWLEATLHPLIRQKCAELEKELQNEYKAAYLIIEIPLLAENIGDHQFDRILVVDVTEEVQVQRTMERSGLSKPEVQQIIDSQASRSDRQNIADEILENIGSRAELEQQVLQLHNKYLDLAANHKNN